MVRTMLGSLKGLCNASFAALNLFFCACLVHVLGLFNILGLQKFLPQISEKLAQKIAWLFSWNNQFFFKRTLNIDYQITGNLNLSKEKWYLLLANHQSWIDILILEQLFFDKIPMRKFFIKKELLWLPFIGWPCWILKFPIMRRYGSKKKTVTARSTSTEDLKTTQKACARFNAFPSTVVNFAEGTRFTEKKKIAQTSPYKHLLKPRAGGIALAIATMQDKLTGIIDVSLGYSHTKHIAWDFFCGRIKQIKIDIAVEKIPFSNLSQYMTDPVCKKNFQTWLNARWEKKDAWLGME